MTITPKRLLGICVIMGVLLLSSCGHNYDALYGKWQLDSTSNYNVITFTEGVMVISFGNEKADSKDLGERHTTVHEIEVLTKSAANGVIHIETGDRNYYEYTVAEENLMLTYRVMDGSIKHDSYHRVED